jgi:predicted nucleotidyltransferase component of viral defense system
LSKKATKNVGASIRARLLNLARKTGRDFDALLLQYCQERFLYRLSISPYKANFVLKGALLLLPYNLPLLRPTKDIDFLAKGTSNDPEAIRNVIEQIAAIEAGDGISFSKANLHVVRIMEGADYEGIRVKIQGRLEEARKVMQLDIAYGDVVTGGPVDMTFPVLMEEQPAPRLKVYSKESSVAEKFESLVKLNILTSRMKDLYDILFMASQSSFELPSLRKAILTTFRHRMTPIENRKVIFEEAFKSSKEKQTQWSAFLKRNRLESFTSFSEAVEHMLIFIDPACSEHLGRSGKRTPWDPGKWKWE